MTTALEKLRSELNNLSNQDTPLESIKDVLNDLLDNVETETMNGGSQPEPWFVYTGPGSITSVPIDAGAFLAWPGGSGFYPGHGTNPLDLTDPTQPVVIADGNYEFVVEVECDEAHAGKNLNSIFYLDLDGVDDGPGSNIPLDSGFARVIIPCRRFLAAGTKIGVFVFHDVPGSIPVLLWVQASWELT